MARRSGRQFGGLAAMVREEAMDIPCYKLSTGEARFPDFFVRLGGFLEMS